MFLQYRTILELQKHCCHYSTHFYEHIHKVLVFCFRCVFQLILSYYYAKLLTVLKTFELDFRQASPRLYCPRPPHPPLCNRLDVWWCLTQAQTSEASLNSYSKESKLTTHFNDRKKNHSGLLVLIIRKMKTSCLPCFPAEKVHSLKITLHYLLLYKTHQTQWGKGAILFWL